jgi:chorismate synthase
MSGLKFVTSGESHGRALAGVIEGIPAGFPLSSDAIDRDLKRRQGGHGRGGRMKIESDHAEIMSGVRWGKTLGSPISIFIENKDWKNWSDGMSVDAADEGAIKPVTKPRPGHADLAGALKYDQKDIRNVLERSSARETAMRVALGAVAKQFLAEFGVAIGSYVVRIGKAKTDLRGHALNEKELLGAFRRSEGSPVRCPDEAAAKKMVALIDRAMKEGNSLGGIFEIFVTGVPAGLGSHVQWDRKLDGRLAQAVMSIQAVKGIEIGMGFDAADRFGSDVMDEIFYKSQSPSATRRDGKSGSGFYRKTNNAGGIEGGMSNGMPIIIRAVMKPIPTLRKPLMSVDIISKKAFQAAYERSDVCAVPAAGVVGEAMTALVIADAFLEKFGGDSKKEIMNNFNSYLSYLSTF